jgi:hypothetical protein
MTWKPMNFHTTRAITVNSALVGVSRNPTGWSISPTALSTWLKTPTWSCASSHHIVDAAATPTT